VRRFADRYAFTFDVPADALWRTVSDTAAVNRDAGLPPVRYTYEPRAGGPATTVAHARLGPLVLEWEEPPFTWEAPHRVAVERRFRSGPFARFASDVRVLADGDGARVEHAVELDAHGALGALLAPAVLARGRAGAERAYALAAQRARRDGELAPTRESVPDLPAGAIARVARFVDALEALRPHTEHEPAIAARLAALVEHADDATVARMRPYVLADAWDLPRDRVLGAMLAATRGGLLDLSWTLICPRCRGQKNSVPALARIGGDVHCESCGAAYAAEFDRNVEVTFDARPSGRTAAPAVYCLGGPHAARQTLAQTALAPGADASLLVTLPAGAYVVQALPDRAARFTVEDDAGAGTLDVRVDDANVRAATSVVRSGAVRVRVENTSARDAVVRVSEAELSDQIATAADVTALQAFRDLFSSEVLAPGTEVAIRALTVVFTDVVGSTEMYAATGDARAFRLVREHFDALQDVIALRRGAVVKTIGDAVMAVFADSRDAVEAALEFAGAAGPLALRVGVHRGPCIAMRANERLDYFGATVNLAARVAHAAGAGEILLTAAVADDARVADIVPDGERGTVLLRGIPAPVEVVLVRTPAATMPQ
jgi:class 3 adenylate cyclase